MSTTSPIFLLPAPQLTDAANIETAVVPLRDRLETVLQTIMAPAVASLPASPIDGQACSYLADATNGIIWRFRYRAGSPSALKWEWDGGTPLFAQVASFSNLSQTTYFNWAGPAITVPLLGDYRVALGFRPYKFDAGKSAAYMSFTVGATAALDADAVNSSHDQDTSSADTREVVKLNVPAGSSLASRFRAAAGVWAPANAWMRVQPIRVG